MHTFLPLVLGRRYTELFLEYHREVARRAATTRLALRYRYQASNRPNARSFLGKAYLFQGKNSEAAAMLDNVISSNKYALFTGGYDLQFHTAYNFMFISLVK